MWGGVSLDIYMHPILYYMLSLYSNYKVIIYWNIAVVKMQTAWREKHWLIVFIHINNWNLDFLSLPKNWSLTFDQ